MKSILVVGLGLFGRHTARKLSELHDQVLAVDCRRDRVEAIANEVTSAAVGDATDPDFLRSLGVGNFDLCIVTIGDNFSSSLQATTLLKELGARQVVARASQDIHARLLLRNGADEIIYPEKELADWTAMRYGCDHLLDYMQLAEGYAIFEVTMPDAWAGQSLRQLDLRRRRGINVLALKTDGRLDMDFNVDTPLLRDQSLLVLGKSKDIQKHFKL